MKKKITIGILAIVLISTTVYSCKKNEISPKQSETIQSETNNKNKVDAEFTSFDEISMSKIQTKFNGVQIVETRLLKGITNGVPFNFTASRLANKDYAYDIDNNGEYDYGIHFNNNDFSSVTYIDANKTIVATGSLKYMSNRTLLAYTPILEKSTIPNNLSANELNHNKPTARSCFESTMSSMEGIFACAATSLAGGWGGVAYCGLVYARCASKYN